MFSLPLCSSKIEQDSSWIFLLSYSLFAIPSTGSLVMLRNSAPDRVNNFWHEWQVRFYRPKISIRMLRFGRALIFPGRLEHKEHSTRELESIRKVKKKKKQEGKIWPFIIFCFFFYSLSSFACSILIRPRAPRWDCDFERCRSRSKINWPSDRTSSFGKFSWNSNRAEFESDWNRWAVE